MTSGNQTYRNAHKKRSGASGEHPASRSAPRCPLRGVPGRRVLSIRACLRPGNALTPRRKCSNRAASNFNNRSPALNFDTMFPIPSATQCGDEKNTQKTAVCRARSTHHTAAKLGQPIKKEKNRGITLSLSLSLSLSLQAIQRGAWMPRAVTKRKYGYGSLHFTLPSAKKYCAAVRFPEAWGIISGLSNRCPAGGMGTKRFVFAYRKIDAFTLVPQ